MSIALIYKEKKVVGWVATSREADDLCMKNHQYSWDYYRNHMDTVSLNEVKQISITNVETT
jgi:hypothetical protein